jgi:hypothetical protein
VDKATWFQPTFVNKNDPFSLFFSSVQYSVVRLKSGQDARDHIKFNSRLAAKVIVPFYPSFYRIRFLPQNLVIYFDPSLLLSQEIFTFMSDIPANSRIKTAIPSKPCLLSLSSNLRHPEFLSGAGISPAFPPFLRSDARCPAPPSFIRSSFSSIESGNIPAIAAFARPSVGHRAFLFNDVISSRST